MNFSSYEDIAGRQRCLQWVPLVSQQLRLRHLCQVIAYNLNNERRQGFYCTLHSTPLCAPFYTSESLICENPKWAELEIRNIPNGSSKALVIRIWQESDIVLTWGINLSGLVYLGNRLANIQPESFVENTVILHLRGGYFTDAKQLRSDLKRPLPFIDSLNVISTEDDTKVYQLRSIRCCAPDAKYSYKVQKLSRLHSLQIDIRNRTADVQTVREKIDAQMGRDWREPSRSCPEEVHDNSEEKVRYAPQLLTMTSLNKMLQIKPTRVQRQEIMRVQKEIECLKFKTKLLQQERDRKHVRLRELKQRYSSLCDDNEEKGSDLMDNYRSLSKDIERLREWKKEYTTIRDNVHRITSDLHHRRRELMSELLILYPIEHDQNHNYYINGIYLPPSDKLLDCSDNGLPAALGYVSHVLTMCALFLQVPLRYPVQHLGSRSVIEDHISPALHDKIREFPLYSRGKDKMQFSYAVYLLNKNITQYLYLLGARAADLKATLPNLLALLQSKEYKSAYRAIKIDDLSDLSSVRSEELPATHRSRKPFASSTNVNDPILERIRYMERLQSPSRVPKRSGSKNRQAETGPGLSQILLVPEAYMNRQMSSKSFKNYLSTNPSDDHKVELNASRDEPAISNCDIVKCEEATQAVPVPREDRNSKRLSRSLDSYTEEDFSEHRNSLELGSDPLLNLNSLKDLQADGVSQQELLQKWLDSGPALICRDENLYPDEILGSSAADGNNPLTMRTEALLNTKSFNLVKPKF